MKYGGKKMRSQRAVKTPKNTGRTRGKGGGSHTKLPSRAGSSFAKIAGKSAYGLRNKRDATRYKKAHAKAFNMDGDNADFT